MKNYIFYEGVWGKCYDDAHKKILLRKPCKNEQEAKYTCEVLSRVYLGREVYYKVD